MAKELSDDTKLRISRYQLSIYQMQNMQHAIGFEHNKIKRGKYIAWRNYFCNYGPCEHWENLCEQGLATSRKIADENRTTYYYVSDEGLKFLGGLLGVKIEESN